MIKRIYLLIVFLSVVFVVKAQLPGGLGGPNRGGFGGNTRPSTGQTPNEKPIDKAKKGKVLDDSTKQIYGPNTLYYFTEKDIYNNLNQKYTIDTTMDMMYKIGFIQRYNHQWVDLGNMGTATRSTYFNMPQNIGQSIGYQAFDIYHTKSLEQQYFNTKSPYTDMYYGAGGRGESGFKFDFTRNINRRWNAGFNLQNFVAPKQYESGSRTGDGSISNWNFRIHNSFFSKDSNYVLLANYNLFRHQIGDEGGVIVDGKSGGLIAAERPFLTTATTSQKRHQFHVYHQYRLGNGFQLFHIADYYAQNNEYFDYNMGSAVTSPVAIYKTINANLGFGNDTIKTLRNYKLLENKVGIKGNYNGFNYRIHLKSRIFAIKDSLNAVFVSKNKINRNETFLGLWLQYRLNEQQKIEAETEYNIGEDFTIKANLSTKRFLFGYESTLISPNIMHERFFSHVLSWENDFKNQFFTKLSAAIPLKINHTNINAFGSYTLLNNYIYYDTLARPIQNTNLITLLNVGANIDYAKNKIRSISQVIFNVKTGENVIRIPFLMINSRISYEFKYRKLLLMQVGIEANYKTAYKADAYMPITQQFYLQDSYSVAQGVMLDPFINMKLNKVRFSVKYSQFNNLLFGENYIGPYYRALKGGIGFAVNWPLFD